MGTDIRLYKERRITENGKKKWVYCGNLKFNNRSYTLFGVLSLGQRTYYDGLGLKPKGLPDDCSEYFHANCRAYDEEFSEIDNSLTIREIWELIHKVIDYQYDPSSSDKWHLNKDRPMDTHAKLSVISDLTSILYELLQDNPEGCSDDDIRCLYSFHH